MSSIYRGVFPVAPTAFTDSGDLDLDSQCRLLDCMVDQGVDGLCILAIGCDPNHVCSPSR